MNLIELNTRLKETDPALYSSFLSPLPDCLRALLVKKAHMAPGGFHTVIEGLTIEQLCAFMIALDFSTMRLIMMDNPGNFSLFISALPHPETEIALFYETLIKTTGDDYIRSKFVNEVLTYLSQPRQQAFLKSVAIPVLNKKFIQKPVGLKWGLRNLQESLSDGRDINLLINQFPSEYILANLKMEALYLISKTKNQFDISYSQTVLAKIGSKAFFYDLLIPEFGHYPYQQFYDFLKEELISRCALPIQHSFFLYAIQFAANRYITDKYHDQPDPSSKGYVRAENLLSMLKTKTEVDNELIATLVQIYKEKGSSENSLFNRIQHYLGLLCKMPTILSMIPEIRKRLNLPEEAATIKPVLVLKNKDGSRKASPEEKMEQEMQLMSFGETPANGEAPKNTDAGIFKRIFS